MKTFLSSLILLAPLCAISCGDDDDGSSGAGLCQQVARKMESCNLAESGSVQRCSAAVFEDAYEECLAGCMAQAQCATLRAFLCNDGNPDPNDRAINCVLSCNQQFSLECADGSGTYTEGDECDGFPDCDDLSDEMNCQTYQCNDGREYGERDKCDNFEDCSDGEDEMGCSDQMGAPIRITCG